MILLSRIKITETFTRKNKISIIVDATLTRLSKFKKTIERIMNKAVMIIETTGVLKRRTILPKNDGTKLSSAIAIGILDEAIKPAFPVVIKASSAAIDTNQYPIFP